MLWWMRLQVTSADPEVLPQALTAAGIPAKRIRRISELDMDLTIRKQDREKLEALLKTKGQEYRVLAQGGVLSVVDRWVHRRWLLVGLLLMFLSSFVLPTRILFVTVSGNQLVPSARILEAAADCGISFWTERREIRSELVKNRLLSEIPELSWVGVNTAGCTAVISVRENPPEQPEKGEGFISHIVAGQDGFILEGTVTAGTGMYSPGQSVTEGEILISGYTDGGSVLRGTRAQGEIYAQTSRKIQAVMPSDALQKGDIKKKTRYYSLILGKKRINFWKGSRISHIDCDRMYAEYSVRLPGGFVLPVSLCVEKITSYDYRTVELLPQQAAEQLRLFSRGYLTEQMTAGQILRCRETFREEDGRYYLSSQCICREMIGREQREQIGDLNG